MSNPGLSGQDDLAPHAKPNMTSSLGRFVERISVADIIAVLTIILLASSAWFVFAPDGHGLKGAEDFPGALYFTLVTLTSLGYGDIVPVGFGRAVAVFDALAGLALVAVLVGKIASERQASLLLLLQTSDSHRRISGFADELMKLRDCVKVAVGAQNIASLSQTLERQVVVARAMKNYLVFNAHQATLTQFGSFTALIGLYDEIGASFDVLDDCLRKATNLEDAASMRLAFASLEGLNRVVDHMARLHTKARPQGPLWRSVLERLRIASPVGPSTAELSARNRASKLLSLMEPRLCAARAWIENGHHPIQASRVLKAWPSSPREAWPKGVHKEIAGALGISNTVVGLCVTDLLESGALPKPAMTQTPPTLKDDGWGERP